MGPLLDSLWPVLAAIAATVFALFASAHVILHKRDVRAAIGWVGLIWLVPFVGTVLYGLLGINRIQRRAAELRLQRFQTSATGARPAERADIRAVLGADNRHLAAISRLVDVMTPLPLTAGNAITPLTGAAAYDAMIEAIGCAERSVAMATYIFDNDRAGQLFAEALAGAVGRGVSVRLLIDGVGARYSWPPITSRLRRRGVMVAEFLPTFVPVHMAYANLRNHRKILVVDGASGFTGGMNVRRSYLLAGDGGNGTQDVHFRIEGPVVAHLMSTFADDWAFCTGERLTDVTWFPDLAPAGTTPARGIVAGPDEDFERIRLVILAALAQAQRRIRVVTPYFLPEPMLMTSLALAAMRGLDVDIVIPERNNLRFVQWASRAKIASLLHSGCRIWQTPPPFDHSKLMTVDAAWCLIGSANWDQRSLRLNFEFNIECYDTALAAKLDALIDAKRAAARPLELAEIEGRSLAAKLRDGAAWLLSPYL